MVQCPQCANFFQVRPGKKLVRLARTDCPVCGATILLDPEDGSKRNALDLCVNVILLIIVVLLLAGLCFVK